MTLKSYDEILTELCDYFDSKITPKIISRNNTNVIYLILKAMAKGYEVLNNTCVVLNNKFNPLTCSNEDLVSVAKLVGTEKLLGSASGLNIIVANNGEVTQNLLAGEYSYSFDSETIFTFEVVSDTAIARGSQSSWLAFSNEIGRFPVEAQTGIAVSSDMTIPSTFSFSCENNINLLGTADETDVAFRYRINTDTTRQDNIVELQTSIRNLPYIFDATIYFNNTLNTVTYDEDIVVPSYHMAIFYSGEPRNSIAQLVASKGIYPTVSTDTSVTLTYDNNVFVGGAYQVHIIPFKPKEYTVHITYKVDSVYNDYEAIENDIRTNLLLQMNMHKHLDYVNEAEIYNKITAMNIAGANILNVDLLVGATSVSYLEVPLSRIAELTGVTFTQVA